MGEKLKPRCGACKFADLMHAGTVECRRFPPAPYFEPTGRVSNIRPRVGAYYWCGEYKSGPDLIGRFAPAGREALSHKGT